MTHADDLIRKAEAIEQLADEYHRLIGLLDQLAHSPEGLQWLEGELERQNEQLRALEVPPELLHDEELQMIADMRRHWASEV
jgi:hypothetical protein